MRDAATLPPGPPLLQVIVDTEEEFDWHAPFARENVGVEAIGHQWTVHPIFAQYNLKPTYMMDYPVASTPDSVAALSELHAKGACEFGAHLHPWVNPPFEEEVSTFHSYAGNLSPDLERRKIACLTERIEQSFGQRPTAYKAGRYGLGPSTADSLLALGYAADLSVLPYTDLRGDGGPDFQAYPNRPFWLDQASGLLEIPLSRGFSGLAGAGGPRLRYGVESPWGRRLRLAGILAKLGVMEKATLTPEGVSFEENRRLITALLRQGHRVLTLSYHSPSLMVGNTPYVQTSAALAAFIDTLKRILAFFFEEIGGQPTTASRIYADAVAARSPG